mmetsp:Transcript_95093/g.132151  ORF Transcript_95093/g.132151 Transcript_95093/m.132151 type:complete len:337 (+) Transcript_95093:57-1067(+)
MADVSAEAKAKAQEAKAAGTAAYKSKQFDEALSKYTEAAELDPTDMVFHMNMGAVYYEMKDYKKSIEACTKATEVAMDNRADFKLLAKAYGRIGKAYVAKEDYESAIKFYDKALTNHRVKDYLSPKQMAQKKLAEIEKKKYINPELAAEAKAKGNEFFKNAQYPDAIAQYSEAIKRNPDDAAFASRIYSNRSACYTKLFELPHALKDADECIKLDPDWVKGYLRKANCLLGMKREGEAESTYKIALEKDPNNAEAADGLRKARMQKYGAQEGLSREERAQRAMQDPEIQGIMGDPVMQQILKQMQEDPGAAQEHLKNPAILEKIQKLVEAGILQMG